MRAFFGGQIKKECRGDRALVIHHQSFGEGKPSGGWSYKIGSKWYLYETGPEIADRVTDRAYIGVSAEAVKDVDMHTRNFSLTDLDKKLVYPCFLREEAETS